MPVMDSISYAAVEAAGRWDAEFFVNSFNEYLSHIAAAPVEWTPLAKVAAKLTSGHTPLNHDVDTGDCPFITVECIEPLSLELNKAKRVYERDIDSELSRVRLAKNDVLISIKRRIVNSVPILDDPPKMAVNQDVAVLTPSEGWNPSYVAAVLVSKVGKYQAYRYQTEQMNPYISVTVLRTLCLPRLPDEFQSSIEAIVRKRVSLLAQADSAYRDAQSALLDRLNWDELAAKRPELHFIERLATTIEAARADAEHFQPQYRRLRKHLKAQGARSVEALCRQRPTRGVQPEFSEDGTVWVIDSKSVRGDALRLNDLDRASLAFYEDPANAKARVGRDDVLLNSTGRGTLGRAGVYDRNEPAMADNHITILRPNSSVCLPEYLSLFLNSPAGIGQSEMFQTGSSGQLELYVHDVLAILVYLPVTDTGKPDLKWQQKLVDGVVSGRQTRVRAAELLEEAKRRIEEEIERLVRRSPRKAGAGKSRS